MIPSYKEICDAAEKFIDDRLPGHKENDDLKFNLYKDLIFTAFVMGGQYVKSSVCNKPIENHDTYTRSL